MMSSNCLYSSTDQSERLRCEHLTLEKKITAVNQIAGYESLETRSHQEFDECLKYSSTLAESRFIKQHFRTCTNIHVYFA